MYLAANEEEALNYLFLGDTNRAISETAMNKASSRSHCIFTVSANLPHTQENDKYVIGPIVMAKHSWMESVSGHHGSTGG